MAFVRYFFYFIANGAKNAIQLLDIRDLFLFGGLTALACGIYLRWGLWLALIISGIFLMAIGYLMRGTHGNR